MSNNNRFEQVDDRQTDAITLFLLTTPQGPFGFITCPAAISGGTLKYDEVSAKMPAQDAFRSAVRLANEIKAAIVVVDPDALWSDQWGVLYREH